MQPPHILPGPCSFQFIGSVPPFGKIPPPPPFTKGGKSENCIALHASLSGLTGLAGFPMLPLHVHEGMSFQGEERWRMQSRA